ncbi:beta-defensin 126-like, partial [Sarcophilus harrisii]|uniref:beta-defensin 126-like n=1 Tax=Sarcophilus harrisii TaxID=9305 RepID=UPI001301F4DE
MKLLLLAFAIVSFLAQRTQGGWGEKKCFNNTGRCRASCKTKEKEHTTCDNKKKCCVPSDKVPKDASDSSASGTTATAPPKAGALTTQAAAAAAAQPPAPARSSCSHSHPSSLATRPYHRRPIAGEVNRVK